MDDHPLIREGLRARLGSQPDLEICGEESAVNEALVSIRATDPDLVIVDLALRNSHGLDLIKRLRAEGSAAKLLVISAYPESLFAERALRAGANGFIGKEALQAHVLEAIRTVLRGERYLSPQMSQRLLAQALDGKRTATGVEALTDRELQIFELIGRGLSTSEIARQLMLSAHTIESHREKIRRKLKLRNGTELMLHAVQWQLAVSQDGASPISPADAGFRNARRGTGNNR